MYHYKLGKLLLRSEENLEELQSPLNFTSDISVEYILKGPESMALKNNSRRQLLQTKTTPNKKPWLKIYQDSKGVYSFDFFINKADFIFDKNQGTITCHLKDILDSNSINHLLLDHVVPYILSIFHDLVAHASAVSIDEKALVFVGRSGVGKSSLATGLVNLGCRLITDDFALLDSPGGITPSYPCLRLWPDSVPHAKSLNIESQNLVSSEKSKQKLRLSETTHFEKESTQIAGIFLVENIVEPKDIAIRPIDSQQQLLLLISNTFALEPNNNSKQFSLLSKLSKENKLFSLTYSQANFTPLELAKEVLNWRRK